MTDYITLPQLPTGRALFAFEQMRPALAAADPGLVAQLDAARDAAAALRDLEGRWAAAAKAHAGAARGEAQAIDREVDKALGEIATLCAVLGRLGPDHPQGAAALAFSKRFFPDGVAPVIRAVFEEELRQVEAMLDAIDDGPAGEWAAALPIEPYVAALRTLAPQFRAELERSAPQVVSFSAVRAERRRAHGELELLVAGIHYLIRDPATRAAAIAPLTFQVERHRALRRGRRTPSVDVDPQSGEEIAIDAPAEG